MRGVEFGGYMSGEFDCRVSSLICTRLANVVAEYQVERLAIEVAFRGDTTTRADRGSVLFTQGPACEVQAAADGARDCRERALMELRSKHWALVLEIGDLYEMLPRKIQERWNQRLVAWRQPGYRRGDFPSQDLPDLDIETAKKLVGELPRQRAARLREQLLGILSGLGRTSEQPKPIDFPEHFAITWDGRVEGRRAYEQIAQITSLRCIAAQLFELDPPCFESTAKVVTQVSRGRMGRAEAEKGAFEFSRQGEKTVLITLSHRLVQKLNTLLRIESA